MSVLSDAPLPLAASHAPGIYAGIPIDDYHGDRTTLSSSGARMLLDPSCPRKFRFAMDHPEPRKLHFEMGTAAHTKLLGDGPELRVCDYDSWRSNAAQAEKLAAEADGAIALLPKQERELNEMVRVVREHPDAGPLLAPDSGIAEQSLYWLHRDTGVTLRARPDWLRRDRVVDYKTGTRADLLGISRDVANFGYHVQDAWYRTAVEVLGLCPPIFTFVLQEKTPPYLITVFELSKTAIDRGKQLMQRAIWTYAECTASGDWPDYMAMADASPNIPEISLPTWAERDF